MAEARVATYERGGSGIVETKTTVCYRGTGTSICVREKSPYTVPNYTGRKMVGGEEACILSMPRRR